MLSTAASIFDDLADAFDPVALARAAGLEPDAWQVDVLRSSTPRLLLNACRQSGKSTICAIMALHTAIYQPASLVLMLSPGLRQSTELFRKAAGIYRQLDRPVPADAETLLRLELANGSRIISLPGSQETVRGFSAPKLVLIDEASRVDDELLTAVTPMLATVSCGRLIAPSTPAGKRGWWYRLWEDREAGWARTEVQAASIPRISEAFLESERKSMPIAMYRQEYECSFEEADMAVFSGDAVSNAIDPEREPLVLDVFSKW
jgi:Terminase large subunit, T4likevirus-type, N-terminal